MDVREKMSNEKRLIDYYYLAEKIECPGVPLVYWEDIEAAPTVDAVPVVRCWECLYYEKGKSYEPYCNHPTHGIPYSNDDDFCSYGERKDGDGNG